MAVKEWAHVDKGSLVPREPHDATNVSFEEFRLLGCYAVWHLTMSPSFGFEQPVSSEFRPNDTLVLLLSKALF
jgi:hypothetical protein